MISSDRYAREGATDESLNRFEQRVRDSTYLRNKVQFARALQQVADACGNGCFRRADLADWKATMAGRICGGSGPPARGDRLPWSADGGAS